MAEQQDTSVEDLFNLGMNIGQTPEGQMQVAQLLNPAWAQKQNEISDMFNLDFLKQAAPTKVSAKKKTSSTTARKTVERVISKIPQAAPAPQAVPSLPGFSAELAPSDQFKLQQNLQPLDMGNQIKTEGGPFTPEGVKYAQNILELQTPGMRQQRASLDEIRKMIGGMQAPIPSQNISWLMGLSDVLTDSDMLSKYKTPEQQQYEQKVGRVNALMGLAKEEGGLTKDEIDLFKANYISDLQHTLGLTKEDIKNIISQRRETGIQTKTDKEIEAEARQKQLDRENALRIAKLKGAKGPGQTVGQKELEKDFVSKYYAPWKAGGAYGGYVKNMNDIDSALTLLDQNKDSMGKTYLKFAPEKLWPEPIRTARKQIISAIAATIKQRGVDSQFAQKEAEAIWQRAFDPSLSAAENIRSLRGEKDMLSTQNEEINRTGKYFESHGQSLVGFTGSEASYGAPSKKAPSGPTTRTYKGKTYQLKPGGNPKNQKDWEIK